MTKITLEIIPSAVPIQTEGYSGQRTSSGRNDEQGNRTAGQNVEKDQAQETEGTAHEQCVPMRTKGIWAL